LLGRQQVIAAPEFLASCQDIDFSRPAECRKHPTLYLPSAAAKRSGFKEKRFSLSLRTSVCAPACGSEEWEPQVICGTTEVGALTRINESISATRSFPERHLTVSIPIPLQPDNDLSYFVAGAAMDIV